MQWFCSYSLNKKRWKLPKRSTGCCSSLQKRFVKRFRYSVSGCSSLFRSHGLKGFHLLGSDWPIQEMLQIEEEKQAPRFSTKYGATHGKGPLSPLGSLTVRAVCFMSQGAFFFFFRMQHCKKELQKKAASHTEMLCIWLPLLRVVLGSGPMPTSPASWLFSSLSLSLSPHAARNNGVYWEGQMAGLRHRLWSGSPSRKGILDSIVGWRHFLGGLTVKSHPHDSSPPAKSPSNAEILKKKKKIWFTIPYVITCL